MSNKANDIFGGKFFNQNNNPWGNAGGNSDTNSGSSNPNRNPGQNQGQKTNPESIDFVDEAIKKGQEFLKEMFGGNGGGGSKKTNNSGNKTPKSIFGLIIGALLVLWLSTGIYKINSDQNGLVLYFGKFHTISTPGLNYHIPTPFGKVIKKSVTRVNTEEFGLDSVSRNSRGRMVGKSVAASNSESLMLTGDENIVDIDFQIQWQIADIKDFIFNLEDPELAIRKASESAIREIIARTPIADALSDGKRRIEQETKILLQQILDSYGAGVRIVLVQMRRVDPPSQVIDAFRDVQTAKADKEKEINQAESYKNDIIPRAKGKASKITENALAYKSQVVADAEGQASRFNAIYAQYARSRIVTKKRMYLEQMEKVYSNIEKVIVDKNISRTGAVPYLPINTNIKSK
ncbi:MAG: membrane protease subunit HflK [Rickettsiales bacterium]|jgi:membrane protease subunit HflK